MLSMFSLFLESETVYIESKWCHIHMWPEASCVSKTVCAVWVEGTANTLSSVNHTAGQSWQSVLHGKQFNTGFTCLRGSAVRSRKVDWWGRNYPMTKLRGKCGKCFPVPYYSSYSNRYLVWRLPYLLVLIQTVNSSCAPYSLRSSVSNVLL